MLTTQSMGLATRCLWSLQEAAPEIEGLLLTHVGGLAVTSTLTGNDSTQRLAAIATTLYLLGERAATALGRGEPQEVTLQLSGDTADDGPRFVSLKPVGYAAVLVAVHQLSRRSPLIDADLNLAAQYLARLIAGHTEAPPEAWQSR